jgi:hypothetical protein
MAERDIRKHVKILGWIYIASSILFLPLGIAIAVSLVFGGLVSNDYGALTFLTIMAVIFGGILILMGVIGIAAGVGLLRRTRWGRKLAILVGLLNITNIPVGTAIGIYTAYILFPETAKAYFE